MDNFFALEINLTKTCNFRCTYCYEQDTEQELFTDDKPEFDFDELVKFINDFKSSDYIKLKHDGKVRLTFWGGEPLMRYDLIKELINYYLDDNDVSFFLYTNGFFKDEILTLAKMTSKFQFQISYDGNDIHTKNRLFPNGDSTLDLVLSNIKEISKELNQKLSLKPTIPMGEDFRGLVGAYKDYLKIYYWYKDEMGFNVNNMHFKPTPGWAHKPSSSDEILNDKYIYEETLEEIAKLEVLFKKSTGKHFFAWFIKGLSICGAGRSLATLDRDYKVYTCHNFLYYDPNEIKGHILYDRERDGKELDELFKNLSMFNNCSLCTQSKPTLKCQECEVDFCMRCNTALYMSSDHPDFLTRWTDMGAQNHICELFKINHKVYTKYFKK
jgi:uncharacterized protein